jgi:hypothetical protein
MPDTPRRGRVQGTLTLSRKGHALGRVLYRIHDAHMQTVRAHLARRVHGLRQRAGGDQREGARRMPGDLRRPGDPEGLTRQALRNPGDHRRDVLCVTRPAGTRIDGAREGRATVRGYRLGWARVTRVACLWLSVSVVACVCRGSGVWHPRGWWRLALCKRGGGGVSQWRR